MCLVLCPVFDVSEIAHTDTGIIVALQRTMMTGLLKYWQIVSNLVFYLHRSRRFFCSFNVALYIDIVTRRHSSRMRTARLLTTV